MKKCPRCGRTFIGDERYCNSCGSPLEDVIEQAAASEPSSEEESATEPQPETPESSAEEKTETANENPESKKDCGQKVGQATDGLSEALGELGAAAKKVADKIGEKAKEGYEKMKEDETFSKYSGKAKEGFEKVMDTPDSTSEYDEADVENYKIISLFAYCGILFIIPLLAGRDSKYARFHTNQGIILFIFSVILTFFSFIPNIGWIFKIGGVFIAILAILGIINAVTGKARELPLIGKFQILT